jgi:hypothetical protein
MSYEATMHRNAHAIFTIAIELYKSIALASLLSLSLQSPAVPASTAVPAATAKQQNDN